LVFGGQVRADVPGGYDAEVLQYDDGTAGWITWGGTYRGVWFNTQDFNPSSIGFALEQMEYWFYNSGWTTDQFYSEIWNGDDTGPVPPRLVQKIVVAIHYAPCYHIFNPPLDVEQNFWGVVNTKRSTGGWPSILGDNTPEEHSFFSDDMITWEPWELGDYFIRAHGEFASSFDAGSWGSIKALF